jgi:hypothetical protein
VYIFTLNNNRVSSPSIDEKRKHNVLFSDRTCRRTSALAASIHRFPGMCVFWRCLFLSSHAARMPEEVKESASEMFIPFM